MLCYWQQQSISFLYVCISVYYALVRLSNTFDEVFHCRQTSLDIDGQHRRNKNPRRTHNEQQKMCIDAALANVWIWLNRNEWPLSAYVLEQRTPHTKVVVWLLLSRSSASLSLSLLLWRWRSVLLCVCVCCVSARARRSFWSFSVMPIVCQ